ncbi:MAG: phosphoribosyltransferase [Spirochaetia bacterium]
MSVAEYISYEQVHQSLADLAEKMKADGMVFDCMVAIGSGGYIPSRILKIYLDCPIFSVTVMHYNDETNTKVAREPQIIQWLSADETALRGKRVLLIDEVDDTRSTLAFCAKRLLERDMLGSLAIAVLHNKRKEKVASIPAQVRYYAGREVDDHWIHYPWEARNIGEHYAKCD